MLRLLSTRWRSCQKQRGALLPLLLPLFLIISAISETNSDFLGMPSKSEKDETSLFETVLAASAVPIDKQLTSVKKGLDDNSNAVDAEDYDNRGTLQGSQDDLDATKFLFAGGRKSLNSGAILNRKPDSEEGVVLHARQSEPDATDSRHKRQTSACGSTLVGSGTVRSPNFPESYQNNLNCLWTLQASSSATRLLLQIRRVSTEACCDFIRIYNTSGLQLSLSGELQPREVTIGSPATISFITDGSVLGTGFEIAFSTMTSDTACGGTLVGSGTIRSPNFPGNYQNNLNCFWTLQASGPATLLTLQIRSVSTEACCDFIRISNTSGLQLSLSGELQPRTITIASPATISFTSDGSVLGTGFEIVFSTVPLACGTTLFGSGTIQSPNFPSSYQNNLNCLWTLQATSPATELLLHIRSVSTEACCDFIRIYNTSGLQLSLSGAPPPQIVAIGSPATISFITDGSVPGTGFQIAFSTRTLDTACGGTLVGSGTIRSPNFPGNYQNNLNCFWTLQASGPATLLMLQIRSLSTEACCDFIRISNTSGLQLSLSGELQPRTITIASPATISFTSDGSVLGTGFEIVFSTVPLACGETLFGSGTIRSPNFPSSYQHNLNCSWTLHATRPATELILQIRNVSTEPCCDVIRIYNTSGLQLSLSGALQPRIVTIGSPATISFITDGSVLGMGFEIAFSTMTSECGGTLVGSGTIRSPNFPGSYENNLNCIWTLQATRAATQLLLQIRRVSTEACCDFLRIYNTSGLQLALSGERQLQNITIGSPATVYFTTDHSVLGMGFEIAFSTVNLDDGFLCGGPVQSPAVITSLELPQHATNGECRWTIRANSSTSVLLEFGYLSTIEYSDYLIISDGSEFQYTFTGKITPYDLLLRLPVEIAFVSDNWFLNVNSTVFNITISDVAGRAPHICRSGHWVMHGELCMSVLWYVPPVQWSQGRNLCRSMGGILAEPDDDEKLQTVGEFLAFHASHTEEVWIGLKRGQVEEEWQWDTGSSMTYSSWATGQPHENGNASCVALTMQGVSGAWINDVCGTERTPMCTLLRRTNTLLCDAT